MNEKKYDFSVEKNHKLKEERDISFEEVISIIQNGGILEVLNHPNQQKYPNQKMYVLDIDGYIHLVPFVKQDEASVFLKKIFKSRKMTKQYLKEKHEE